MAARTGQSKTNVYERLKALGLAPRPARPRPIPVPPEELLALRRAGLTVREIAGRIGLSRAVVYERLKRLRERRVEVPGPSRPHAADAGRG
jgi:predicted DNA-binding transcriptional regulator AlpA